jgi:G3E family GTPase
MTPLITSQIQCADLIIVSKNDLATTEQIESARRLAREINPTARIVSAAAQAHLEAELISELLPWKN